MSIGGIITETIFTGTSAAACCTGVKLHQKLTSFMSGGRKVVEVGPMKNYALFGGILYVAYRLCETVRRYFNGKDNGKNELPLAISAVHITRVMMCSVQAVSMSQGLLFYAAMKVSTAVVDKVLS